MPVEHTPIQGVLTGVSLDTKPPYGGILAVSASQHGGLYEQCEWGVFDNALTTPLTGKL